MISQITKLQKGQVKFHGIIETIRDKKINAICNIERFFWKNSIIY